MGVTEDMGVHWGHRRGGSTLGGSLSTQNGMGWELKTRECIRVIGDTRGHGVTEDMRGHQGSLGTWEGTGITRDGH